MPKQERLLLLGSAAAALVLRVLASLHYRFDSDEQQHLHVAWGWTAGLVQYRDLFDNHAPLFHMLMAPLLALFGERADILLWMRLPMIVPFAIVVWATWTLGRRLYDERVAAWSAMLLVLFPPFFLKSLEFRTDNLWNALWMLAAAAILARGRPFLIGLLLGAALAVSMKTTLIVVTLLLTAILTRVFTKTRAGFRWLEAAAGFAIVPGVLAIYFILAGAWDALVYCNFTFNSNLALTRPYAWVGRAIFPFTFGAVVFAAWRFRRSEDVWRYFFALFMGVYAVTLAGFWILISPRDFLPLMPLGAIFAAALLTRARKPLQALATAIALSFGALWYYADRFEDHTDWHITMMDQALRLSRPGEFVMDLKGETIYRRRPFYYAFEAITRAQIARGILRDTVAADVVRTRTYVAQADGPMWPPHARAFLADHFVDVGRLRAAGQWIGDDAIFTIAILGEYVIVTKDGEARGLLNGTPYRGARVLAAGTHRFEGEQNAAVLWAPAYRRGHSPFHLRDRDF